MIYLKKYVAHLTITPNSTVSNSITAVAGGNLTVEEQLTLGGDLTLSDNADAKILVADGNNFNSVAVSGDIAITNAGVMTAANVVEGSMLNNNVISGQTEMTGDLEDTDELLISDAGTIKRADFSVVRDAVFNDVSGDATIAAGGALTIAANDAVQAAMLNDDIISEQTEMTGDLEDTDELLISDAGTVKRADFSVVRDAVFNDVSGDATIAAGGALTIANNAVETESADESVTLAKLAHAAANTVLVRDANSEGDPSFKAVADKEILIGDGTGFTAAALSGDVTMTNAGVITAGANVIEGNVKQ